MNDTTRLVGRIAAWTTAAVFGAALLSGYAQAQPGAQPAAQPQAQSSAAPSATPRPSRSPGTRPSDRPKPNPSEGERRREGRRKPGRIGRHVLHGETVVATDQGNVTHVVQRGVVTAISGSTFTVRSSDGYTVTWTRNADTKVRTGPKDSEQRALRVGDDVMAHGVRRSASSVLARQVRVVPEGAEDRGDPGDPGDQPA